MAAPASTRAQALALMRAPDGPSDREIARRLGLSNKTVSRWRAQHDIARSGTDAEPAGWLDAPALRDALARAGISDHQFRRWRSAGLLPGPRRSWQQRGSRAVYPPSVIEQATAAREMVRRHHNLDTAALGLFGLGWPVREDRLRSAHLAWIIASYEQLSIYQQILDAPAEAEWGDQAIAELARALTKARRFRSMRTSAIRRPGERVVDAAWDHLERTTTLGLRGPLGDGVTTELLSHWGASGNLDAQLSAGRTVQNAFQLTELAEAAMHADYSALIAARAAAVASRSLMIVIKDMHSMQAAKPGERPLLLSERDDLDPVLIAQEGLTFAALVRQPGLGDDFADAATGFADLDNLRKLITEAPEPLPAMEALFSRFQWHGEPAADA